MFRESIRDCSRFGASPRTWKLSQGCFVDVIAPWTFGVRSIGNRRRDGGGIDGSDLGCDGEYRNGDGFDSNRRDDNRLIRDRRFTAFTVSVSGGIDAYDRLSTRRILKLHPHTLILAGTALCHAIHC